MQKASLTTEQHGEIAKTVEALVESTFQALNQLDADRFYSHFSDATLHAMNGLVVPSWHDHMEQGRKFIASLREAHYELGEARVEVLTPDVAVWLGTWSFAATDKGGAKTSAVAAQTFVCARQSGTWKIVHSHVSEPGGSYGPYAHGEGAGGEGAG